MVILVRRVSIQFVTLVSGGYLDFCGLFMCGNGIFYLVFMHGDVGFLYLQLP